MAAGYTLDSLSVFAEDARKLGIMTVDAQEAYFRSRFPAVTDSPDQIRAFFEMMLPGQNVTKFSNSDMRQRRLDHGNAFNTAIHLSAEYGSIKRNPGPENELRFMSAVYNPERTQADIDHNRNLRDAIGRGDFKEVGRIYSEHVMNLPSFDPEMLQNLSDTDIPQVYRELYPLSIASYEAKRFLSDSRPSIVAMREGMSEESKERLAELINHMDTLSSLKIRFDNMFSPFYPFIDSSKLACTEENIEALAGDVPAETSTLLSRYSATLSAELGFTANGFGEDTGRLLEQAGIDPKQVTVRDFYGKETPLSYYDGDCSEIFKRSEPVFCTSGDQLKAFKMEGRTIIEVQPEQAVNDCFEKILPRAIEEADNLLNSKFADPRWLFTSSAEYRGMQKALADYQAALGDKPGVAEQNSEKAMQALQALGTTSKAYFDRKGVDTSEYLDYKSFQARSPIAQGMSSRELARMQAAYDLMNIHNNTMGAIKMQKELSGMPAYNKPLPPNKNTPYNEKVQQINNTISKSEFLNDPLEAVNGNNTGELLRQELKTSLTDPQNGLLNKKFFSAQDRQAAEDVLAKAVILSMIRSGRKAFDPPSKIESLYQLKAEKTMSMIKQTPAFQQAKGKFISPDGLRNFLAEHREAKVNKEIQNQSRENSAMQKSNQPKPQIQLQLNTAQNAPQQIQQPQPKSQAPSMGGGAMS